MRPNKFPSEKFKKCPKWIYPVITLVLSILIYIGLRYIFKSPFGTYKFKNIYGSSTIVYENTYGIPYISGTTNQAIAFAIGFSHAADRLYDLNFHRAMASGELSEFLGKEALEFDRYMRSLQLSKIVTREVDSLSQENMAFLQAYTDGINEYTNQLIVRPVEFLLLRISFKPWTVKDSLMVFKMLSFSFSEHWKLTALRTIIAHKMGRKLAEKLVPFDTGEIFGKAAPINSQDIPLKFIDQKLKSDFSISSAGSNIEDPGIDFDFLENLKFRGRFDWTGSSSWAIHKSKSVAGKALLGTSLNGVHGIPSEIYLITIKYPQGLKLTGATVAGFPLIISGRNEHVAWSIGPSFIENIDLYSVKISNDGRQYFRNGKWENLISSTETIKVRGKGEVPHIIYRTNHGPIISSISR